MLTSVPVAGDRGEIDERAPATPRRRGLGIASRPRARRVLATVLFFDVVQSTALASELGDAKWAKLLVRMRHAVAKELKRGGGREQDFSGDGFLAVFSEPAQAVRTAAQIVVALHTLGLDIRCGIHAGECEIVEGKMRGIAVHIGARVMALASAAEVLVTGTVRELVVGSGIRFEEFGVHELKGVEGSWLVYRAVDFDGVAVEPPLSLDESTAAIAALDLKHRGSRNARAGIAAAIAALAFAAAILLLVLHGGAGRHFGTNSNVRLDPKTGRVLRVVDDPHAVRNFPTHVFTYRGALWNWDDNYGLVRWDMQTGKQLAAFGDRRTAGCPYEPGWDIAFGTIWLWCAHNAQQTAPWTLMRLDELSYRHLATIKLPATYGTIASSGWGLGAYWVVDPVGELVRVDAFTSRITGTYFTPIRTTGSCTSPSWYPGVVGPVIVDHVLWFAQCNPNELISFDPETRHASTYPIPQRVGWLLAVPSDPNQLWLFDPQGGTLTSFSTDSHTMGDPIALSGAPQSTAVTKSTIWVAAGRVVDRVGVFLDFHTLTTIPVPSGVWASSIAVDPGTGALWITNNTYAMQNPEWAGESGP